ncbi:hypothetical protein DFH08DRAFT_209970 [Mycena albidolilacea]|uniref:Uncharacterized protein n=1 Tax=Mycena albidolilacea TaxID=1033008 RepID=A0AAD7ESJ2_9AGAR|nr:hypothetical protein DFH08DRAFT_209970 [Mycena albidolilacea]
MHFLCIVTVFAYVFSVIPLSFATISVVTPLTAATCNPVQISWQGGTAPYLLYPFCHSSKCCGAKSWAVSRSSIYLERRRQLTRNYRGHLRAGQHWRHWGLFTIYHRTPRHRSGQSLQHAGDGWQRYI